MAKKVALVFSIFTLFLFTEMSAQNNVYFTGVGRALVNNDQLKDETDLASKLKASGGYTLFDLGVYANPNEVLRGGVILRIRNEFGGFFGDGAMLQFRQLQMEGVIAKKVKYDIGDIYIKQTRYTLWNEDNMSHEYEADIFSLRRGIINYENFFVGNNWRMQGVNAKSKINFSKGADSLLIRAYGGRTMQTNFTTIPDRYFYGGRLDLLQSKYFRIGGNLAGISDIAGTVKDAQVNYANLVYTTDFEASLDKSEKFKFSIKGEVGGSNFNLDRTSDSIHHEFNDFFYDIGGEVAYKPLNLSLGLSYRDVGFNFNSPMAQTRRVAQPADITLTTFPVMNDETRKRQISLFDFYQQEDLLYNQAISTTLMSYFVQYNMVDPYGQATPNRKGFTAYAGLKPTNKIFKANIEVNRLSEIVSEGDSLTHAKRKLTKIRGGFVFNLSQLLEFKKLIALNLGIRTESSKRGGVNPIDLSSSLIDLGLDVEVFKSFHLLGGVKLFNVKGNEIKTGRNILNQVDSFGPALNFNQTQNIIATGLRYDFDNSAYFSMQYHMVEYNDRLTPLNTYKLNQWFFVFGLKF